MKRKSRNRSQRRDPSKFTVPAPSNFTGGTLSNGVRIQSLDQLVLNPVADGNPTPGILVDGLPVTSAVQTTAFEIEVSITRSPAAAGRTLTIAPSMEGIRNIRGGGLALGQIVF